MVGELSGNEANCDCNYVMENAQLIMCVLCVEAVTPRGMYASTMLAWLHGDGG